MFCTFGKVLLRKANAKRSLMFCSEGDESHDHPGLWAEGMTAHLDYTRIRSRHILWTFGKEA